MNTFVILHVSPRIPGAFEPFRMKFTDCDLIEAESIMTDPDPAFFGPDGPDPEECEIVFEEVTPLDENPDT